MSRIAPWKWFLSTVCNVTWCLVRWRIPLLIRWLHISTTARYCKLHISFFFLKKLPIISSVLLKFPAQFNDSVFLLFIYFLVASSLPPSFFHPPRVLPDAGCCWVLAVPFHRIFLLRAPSKLMKCRSAADTPEHRQCWESRCTGRWWKD